MPTLNNNSLIRLSTLAEKTGLSVHCIRNYVDQGLIKVSDRTKGGLLLFDEIAIQRLRFIRVVLVNTSLNINKLTGHSQLRENP